MVWMLDGGTARSDRECLDGQVVGFYRRHTGKCAEGQNRKVWANSPENPISIRASLSEDNGWTKQEYVVMKCALV